MLILYRDEEQLDEIAYKCGHLLRGVKNIKKIKTRFWEEKLMKNSSWNFPWRCSLIVSIRGIKIYKTLIKLMFL
jgi:hypothetical protein